MSVELTAIFAKAVQGISPPSFHDTVAVFGRAGMDQAIHCPP